MRSSANFRPHARTHARQDTHARTHARTSENLRLLKPQTCNLRKQIYIMPNGKRQLRRKLKLHKKQLEQKTTRTKNNSNFDFRINGHLNFLSKKETKGLRSA